MTICPVCERAQDSGLLCDRVIVNGRDVSCTANLERDLGDVPALVADLDIATSRQARIGTPGRGGLASQRWAYNPGSSESDWIFANVLTTWARDLAGDDAAYAPGDWSRSGVNYAARYLLLRMNEIRRHPAVAELVDEITDAIAQARRAVDRPADRVYLGQCLFKEADVTCYEELYARPGASEVRCKLCGIEHPVAERRAWLLNRARDMLFTVKEASEMMMDVGAIKVTQASIRGYLHRKRIAYRPGTTTIRLGDLIDVVMDDSERRTA